LLLYIFVQKRKAYDTLVELNIELANTDKTRQSKEKYTNSQLDEDKKKLLSDKIIEIMESSEPFLNNKYSIDELAAEIETNKKYVSQIINEEFNTNFNNFINRYRVNYARKLMLMPESKKLSLSGIAENSGFNTRATFITAFKKFAGVTPSYFVSKNKRT
jgi:AraC-like DNA-binding protein